jgi:hypothetical protein
LKEIAVCAGHEVLLVVDDKFVLVVDGFQASSPRLTQLFHITIFIIKILITS